ncbi:MAG: triple tyrosine motif-containing protein [Bacteroidales bacterium]|nr:triple tyrosine motif-containing protein [Bacteroidales bacterium]
MRALFFLLFLLSPVLSQGQIKSIGIPSIINHSRISTGSGTQNWDITQSSTGFIYFGNNDGILEFDGTHWNVYPVPNASVVRSVLAVGDTIYAGAFEEIGFLAPDDTGRLKWHSLNHLVPEQYAQFAEVWHIYATPGRIIFQTFQYIFLYENNIIRVIEPLSDLSLMHNARNRLYVADTDNGFFVLADDSLQLISNHPVFFRNEIRFVLPFRQHDLLIGTSNEGLFVWNGSNLKPWNVDINKLLIRDNLYSGTMLSYGDYAFGTISNGLFITNQNGDLLQHVNRFKGLQNNTILSIYEDRRRNLWLGLDNGIDYVEASSPLTFINYNFNIESCYASIIHNDILYVGTNQGLFAAKRDDLSNSLNVSDIFRMIPGTEGQVWSLEVIDGILLCGHNFGAFQIDGFHARKLSDIRGFWSFLQPSGMQDTLIAGTYTGLVSFIKKGGTWHFLQKIEGFNESSRSFYMDDKQKLWVAHGYRGLYKLQLSKDMSKTKQLGFYFNSNGLPGSLPYNIQVFNKEMFITTYDGIYTYDYGTGNFTSDNILDGLLGDKAFIDKIYQDRQRNVWYFTDEYMGVLRLLEDGTYRDITAPLFGLNDHIIPAFQNIFVCDRQHAYIGSQKGLVHYDPNIIKDYNYTEGLYFTDITFYGRREPVSLHYFSSLLKGQHDERIRMPFALNSVAFRFTTPAFENPHKVVYSYRLIGLEDKWSAWDALNFKEYTNLREGNYVFEVKARNAFGVESTVRQFQFTVAPPLLRSTAAYIFYVFLILLIIAVNAYYIRQRILRIRQREKIRHEKRLARREQIFKEKSALSEKEILHLRNESLHNEMKHKNQELANATLHLIQKNKTLTSLKNELHQVLKSMPDDNPEKHSVSKLLRNVNRDLRNEKNWELFNSYFDEVHQDFINRLKETYSDLTPKELRLCAYLRMNISTKEIAPLMNISIRGVEISRYRLRKKLKLDPKENLADFIISF